MVLRLVVCLSFALALPSFASASPVVAGFGDSNTCDTCNDGSYLRLLADYLEPDPIIDDNGQSSDLTSGVLSRLDAWINDGNTADVMVLLAGTTDMYQAVGGWWNRPYDPVWTLGNIEDMIDMVLAESIPLILVAPLMEQIVIPESSTILLLASGLVGLAFFGHSRRKAF